MIKKISKLRNHFIQFCSQKIDLHDNINDLFKQASQRSIIFCDIKKVHQNIRDNLEEIDQQMLVKVIWGLTRTKDAQTSQIIIQLEKRCIDFLNICQSREDALLMWSFSKLNCGSDIFWSKIIKKINTNIQTYKSQDLSNICWSLATLHRQKSKIYQNNTLVNEIWQEIEKILLKSPSHLKETQVLSNIVWSFSQTQNGSLKLFVLFQQNMNYKVNQMNNQCNPYQIGIANLLWSLSNFNNEYQLKILDWSKIEQIIQQQQDKFNTIETIQIIKAFDKNNKGNISFWKILINKIYSLMDKDIGKEDLGIVLLNIVKRDKDFNIQKIQNFLQIIDKNIKKMNEGDCNKLIYCLDYLKKEQKEQLIKIIIKFFVNQRDNFSLSYLKSISQLQKLTRNNEFFQKFNKQVLERIEQFDNEQLLAIFNKSLENKEIKDQFMKFILLRFYDIKKLKIPQIPQLIHNLGIYTFKNKKSNNEIESLFDKLEIYLSNESEQFTQNQIIRIKYGFFLADFGKEEFFKNHKNYEIDNEETFLQLQRIMSKKFNLFDKSQQNELYRNVERLQFKTQTLKNIFKNLLMLRKSQLNTFMDDELKEAFLKHIQMINNISLKKELEQLYDQLNQSN